MEFLPESSSSLSHDDYNLISLCILQTAANNTTGALAGEIIALVQQKTGFDPEPINEVFMTLAGAGVIERSLTDATAGVVLTAVGQTLLDNYDTLMPMQGDQSSTPD